MKNMSKFIGILFLVFVIFLVIVTIRNAKISEYNQKHMIKNDDELLGVRFEVPRENKNPVRVNLYIPKDITEKTPVIFNIHGGAFIAGDADTLDSQSDRLSRELNVAVVNINYTLAKDGYDMNFGVDEVKDTVIYFKEHADEYNIDIDKFFMLGYSAGGYHAMNAVVALKKDNIDVRGQILCYSFIGEIVTKYNELNEEQRKSIAPTLFVLADKDPISDGSLKYEAVLKENGISTKVKKFDTSKHGFIEENNPEYENLKNIISKSPEQEKLAREAEKYILNWINEIIGK